MPLKTIVKVSQISNLSDARYCAGMGVEMLGFRVIPGREDYMPPTLYQDIRGWISGPAIIAELYGISTPDQIETVIQTYAPDFFELSYTEYLTFGKDLVLPCIIYFPYAAETHTARFHENVSYILVDENTSCQDISTNVPVLVKVSTVKSLNTKLSAVCFRGFVLEGTGALRPGVTNYDQLGAILETLEEE